MYIDNRSGMNAWPENQGSSRKRIREPVIDNYYVVIDNYQYKKQELIKSKSFWFWVYAFRHSEAVSGRWSYGTGDREPATGN
jgi:hypothetical protein